MADAFLGKALAAFGRAAIGADILTARVIAVGHTTPTIKTLDGFAVLVLAVQSHPSAALTALQARILRAFVQDCHSLAPLVLRGI